MINSASNFHSTLQVADEPDKLYKKIEIEMKANEARTIESYEKFVQMAAKHLDITVEKRYEFISNARIK